MARLNYYWTALTVLSCIVLYVLHRKDHSIIAGLLGLLFFSFFLYYVVKLGVFVYRGQRRFK